MKKHILISISTFLSFLLITACTSPGKGGGNNDTASTTPELQGVSSVAILRFIEAAESELPDALHSLMLRRHGKIIAEGWWAPYSRETPHMLYSLSKSFTSTAIGMAVDEGLISIDDPVISFFPEETPDEPSQNLKAMRIRDLLKMNSGHQWGTSEGMRQAETWVEGFLAQEVQFKPGTHFVYNSGATYILSAIIQKVTGMTVLDYLNPRLFEPLGIENPTWETSPQGINTGGWGLSITTEDISKFGQLYLQKGEWEGKQLLSEAWIEEASSFQTSNGSNPDSDWEQGYGYQFWRCRHNVYRGDGAFGQFCIVMPDQDAVLAITSGTGDMQKVMDLVWTYLLPAMKEGPLPADEEGVSRLNDKLKSLSIAFAQGEETSSVSPDISGRSFEILSKDADISSVSFDFKASPPVITVNSIDGKHLIKSGYREWEPGRISNPQFISTKAAVSGAWATPDRYVMKIVHTETPYISTYTFLFKGDQVFLDRELNVSFGPKKLPQLRGVLSR